MHQVALTCNGAMDLGAILQFNGNRLMAELHQKPVCSIENGLLMQDFLPKYLPHTTGSQEQVSSLACVSH